LPTHKWMIMLDITLVKGVEWLHMPSMDIKSL